MKKSKGKTFLGSIFKQNRAKNYVQLFSNLMLGALNLDFSNTVYTHLCISAPYIFLPYTTQPFLLCCAENTGNEQHIEHII